jgi:hypothetical protein
MFGYEFGQERHREYVGDRSWSRMWSLRTTVRWASVIAKFENLISSMQQSGHRLILFVLQETKSRSWSDAVHFWRIKDT